jgi:succinate-acetate transporter protein
MTTFASSCVKAGFFGGAPATLMVLGLAVFFLVYFFVPHLATSVAGDAVGLYLLGWLIFTFYMTIASLRTNVAAL